MAYPPLRSMNGALNAGATDGKYKKLRPDTECSTSVDGASNSTYHSREQLSLLYYGMGEARMMHVPGTNRTVTEPNYYPNAFEREEDGAVFGKAW